MNLIEALSNAVVDNDLKQVQILIQAGANVNEPLEENCTVLMLAASRGYLDVVRTLVEAGAEIDTVSDHGDYALGQAAQGCYQMVFNYLAPLCSPEKKKIFEEKALLATAPDRSAEVVDLLFRDGTDLNVKNISNEGETALMLATQFRNLEFAEALLRLGADVNAADFNGKTALMYGAKPRSREEMRMEKTAEKQIQLIQALIASGADLEATSKTGQTTLILAAEYGLPEVVSLLLQLGANPDHQDNQGYTALVYAERRENILQADKTRRSEIINLLQHASTQ